MCFKGFYLLYIKVLDKFHVKINVDRKDMNNTQDGIIFGRV